MNNTKREIYLDHAATTYLDPRVKAAMEPYFEVYFGNPSSLYKSGQRAKKAVDESRKTIANILNCQTNEIIFTSSGTESINLAIQGVCKALDSANMITKTLNTKVAVEGQKRHIVTTQIEHDAVLSTCKALESHGYDITYLPVDGNGLVSVDAVVAALTENTALVSVMYANNEIGTIQPIAEIAQLCKEKKVYFHVDACQGAGALSLDVEALGIDLLTLNASKIYGPKGVGLLYVRQGIPLQPLIYGGGQEFGVRSGTENVAGIVGLAKALYLVNSEKNAENKRLSGLRDYLIGEISDKIKGVVLNGDRVKRLPNNVNFSFTGVDGESIVLALDTYGIACATGSACNAASTEPSHVLLSIDKSIERAQSAVRFTLGKRTSKADLEYTVKCLVEVVTKLRNINKN